MSSAVFLTDRQHDLNVFSTQANAEGWMEGIDVEDGEYVVAYRVDGTCLTPTTNGSQVLLVPTGDVEPDALRAWLRDYAARVPTAPQITDPEAFAAGWLSARPRLWFMRWLPTGRAGQ